jgi:Zn-dependent protease
VSDEGATIAGVPLRARPGLAVVLGAGVVLRWAQARQTTFVHVPPVPPAPAFKPGELATADALKRWLAADRLQDVTATITHPSLIWVVVAVVGSVLTYVLSVLAHEIGHLVAARRVGLDVTAVELNAFGGFVELADDDRLTAGSLAQIAAAGPLVTAALVAISAGLLTALGWPVTGQPDVDTGAAMALAYVLTACFWANAVALVINLLPLRGLDGAKLTEAARLWVGRRGGRVGAP